MDLDQGETLDAILRGHFDMFLRRCVQTLNPGTPFLDNWHIQAMAYRLEQIRTGEENRLIINLPPRYLKSLTASVAFPAYVLGLEPWRRIICISYSSELADKHGRDFRAIVESEWYRRAFPEMRTTRSLDDEVLTTHKGFRKSTSTQGTLTGLGGDLFIIDDPLKGADAQSEVMRTKINRWVTNTLISRLDNKEKGAIVVVMQRVHMDDLTGYLLGLQSDWRLVDFPAIADEEDKISVGRNKIYMRQPGALHPEHESLQSLRSLERAMGPDDFAAQYQQCPVRSGGSMIKREWLRYYDELPERTRKMKVVQSWDTAGKDTPHSDWSVCTTWLIDNGDYYLIDLVRGRYDYPRLREVAIALAEQYKPDFVLIEDSSTGTALIPDLKQLKGLSLGVTAVPVERDKVGRLYVQEIKFATGRVHFPRKAPFLGVLEAELLAFPRGKHDDQVDSITQALAQDLSLSRFKNYDWVS